VLTATDLERAEAGFPVKQSGPLDVVETQHQEVQASIWSFNNTTARINSGATYSLVTCMTPNLFCVKYLCREIIPFKHVHTTVLLDIV
jgi:hypothetical protein